MKPVAYLHKRYVPGNPPEVEVTLAKANPWGKPGIDYSETFRVKRWPLFKASQFDANDAPRKGLEE